MKMKYFLIVLVLSSCAFAGKLKNNPVTASATAVSFLRGLTKFLLVERENPKEAKLLKSQLAQKVSNYNLVSVLEGMGLKLRNLPKDKIDKVREIYVNNWAAVINFYKSDIRFHKLKILGPTTTKSSLHDGMVSVLIPASHPGYPRKVNILVTCLKEKKQWKIQLVRLFPPDLK